MNASRTQTQFLPHSQSQLGFSLFELLVVVGLLIVVAIYFYPQLEAKRQTQRREQAQVALMQLAQAMDNFKIERGTYAGAAGSAAEPLTEGSPWLVSSEVPGGGAQTYYRLRIGFANEYGYEVRAVPMGEQIEDPCGTLTLTAKLARGLVNARNGYRRADCWTVPEELATITSR